MCGILYGHSFLGNPVNKTILEMFEAQKHRGLKGFGIFDGSHNNIIRSANEDKVLKWLKKYDSDIIMFHHRAPTSTINVKRAAHPFASKDYFGDSQYVLIHNGHISNSRDLKKDHEKLGIVYQSQLQDGTFNDSEALMWDFALTMEGKQDKLKAYGGIAFICVKMTKGKLDKLYFGRNTNPIKILRDKTGIMLSSEGEGEDATPHQLYTFNYETSKLTQRYFHVPGYSAQTYTQNWERLRNNTTQETRTLPSGIRYSVPVSGTPSRYWNSSLNRWIYQNPEDDPKFISYDTLGNAIYEDDLDFEEFDTYEDWQNRGKKSREETIEEIADMYSGDNSDDDAAFTQRYNRLQKSISNKRIIKRYKRYLYKNKGIINLAHEQVEEDYEDLWQLFDGTWEPELMEELALLERLVVHIEKDTEYLTEESVSSLYKRRK